MKSHLPFFKQIDQNLEKELQAQLYNHKTNKNDEILLNQGLYMSANNFSDSNSD